LRAYLGLGSNVGDRFANLRAAREALGRRGLTVVASSSVYETAPQGEILDQPDFLNACIAVETELGPEELLDECKAVESELGRQPGGPRHAPRPIDVDLLLLGGLEHSSERLSLPHVEIRSRRFVLEPLLELDPNLTLPDGTVLADVLAGLAGQRVDRLESLSPRARDNRRHAARGRRRQHADPHRDVPRRGARGALALRHREGVDLG
jgi:2-amino-4-hydroxy-6-hydroxymethyldihydropteridine diphosphokinase